MNMTKRYYGMLNRYLNGIVSLEDGYFINHYHTIVRINYTKKLTLDKNLMILFKVNIIENLMELINIDYANRISHIDYTIDNISDLLPLEKLSFDKDRLIGATILINCNINSPCHGYAYLLTYYYGHDIKIERIYNSPNELIDEYSEWVIEPIMETYIIHDDDMITIDHDSFSTYLCYN